MRYAKSIRIRNQLKCNFKEYATVIIKLIIANIEDSQYGKRNT